MRTGCCSRRHSPLLTLVSFPRVAKSEETGREREREREKEKTKRKRWDNECDTG